MLYLVVADDRVLAYPNANTLRYLPIVKAPNSANGDETPFKSSQNRSVINKQIKKAQNGHAS